jgi:hypothetical protein
MGFVAGSISVETEESSKHLKMRKAKGPEDGRDSCCMSWELDFHLPGRKSSQLYSSFPIMADISHPLLPPHVPAGRSLPQAQPRKTKPESKIYPFQ